MEKRNVEEILQSRGVFGLTTAIKEDVVEKLVREILIFSIQNPDKPIYIVFNCTGGSVRPALFVYDMLKSLPNETIGINIGSCASAAMLIYAACKKRQMLPHANFLMHAIDQNVRIKSTSEKREEGLAAILENRQTTRMDALNIYKKEFEMDEDTFAHLNKIGEDYDIRIYSDDAKELGLIHEIITKLPLWENS